MGRRTRDELETENLAIYRELEDMRDRLDSLLAVDDGELDGDGQDDPVANSGDCSDPQYEGERDD
jgi:hypothetical protein